MILNKTCLDRSLDYAWTVLGRSAAAFHFGVLLHTGAFALRGRSRAQPIGEFVLFAVRSPDGTPRAPEGDPRPLGGKAPRPWRKARARVRPRVSRVYAPGLSARVPGYSANAHAPSPTSRAQRAVWSGLAYDSPMRFRFRHSAALRSGCAVPMTPLRARDSGAVVPPWSRSPIHANVI